MNNYRFALEITLWNPVGEVEETHYFSDHSFVTSATDTPAHTWFMPRIQQPGLIQRACFTGGMTGGASRIGYGETTLVNNDGALDALIDYGFDGRRIVLRYGRVGDAYPAAWTTLLTGTMGVPGWETTRLALRVRDRLEDLRVELQTNFYAGNNSLPNGLEGIEELKDKPKPLCFGFVKNIPATLVNSSRLIYQVHDGAILSVLSVLDRGASLILGANYTSQSDMETNAPAAGYYRSWLAGGYFRLGATPSGLVTAWVSGVDIQVPGALLKAIALRAGIAEGDISASDVIAMDASSDVVGVWFDQSTTALAAMDTIAASANAWYGFDEFGVLRMAKLTAPSGTPVATLTTENLQKIEVQTAADGANGVPPYRVNIHYERNYSVQTTDVAGSVPAATRGWLAQGIRVTSAEDADVLAAHPLSQPLTIETTLTDAAEAGAFAATTLALFGTRRDRVSVTVNLGQDTLLNLSLGAVVNVIYPRFGYNAGKLFRILGLKIDWQRRKADLELWG